MQWAKVDSMGADGAYIRFDASTLQKPLKIPKGVSVSQGDRLLVEKVSGQYEIIQVFG